MFNMAETGFSYLRSRGKITNSRVDSMESSDSGIVSDSDGESIDSEDYGKKFQDLKREIMVRKNDVVWNRLYLKLPCLNIVPPTGEISVVATGPGEGVKNINLEPTSPSRKVEWKKNKNSEGFAPFGEWTKRHPRAYGVGTSMYECDPVTNKTTGDPVADVYAVVAGENSCILALADGVNWGESPRLAARCAVAGCLQYLSENLHKATTTRAVMGSLLNGFNKAQDCIMQNNATMTTLCVAVVCQLEASDRWGLCVVNVGDSLAFTYRRDKGVQEVTVGSHCENEERDMKCPGGSLGLVDGYNPDLRNLTFSYTTVDSGDIVFLTSDGVSDNFDPVVLQCRHCKIPDVIRSKSLDSTLDVIQRSARRTAENDLHVSRSDDCVTDSQTYDVPMVRHRKMLDLMTEVIQQEGLEDSISASEVCAKLLFHVWRCTENKRTFMEDVHREDHKVQELRGQLRTARNSEITRQMHELPGKLDHAAVVAFEVGHFSSNPLRLLQPNGRTNGSQGASFVSRISELLRGVSNSSRRTSDNDEFETDSAESDSLEELYPLFGISKEK